MTCGIQHSVQQGGQKFSQKMVSQEPTYDRKLKVKRPRKRKGQTKWV